MTLNRSSEGRKEDQKKYFQTEDLAQMRGSNSVAKLGNKLSTQIGDDKILFRTEHLSSVRLNILKLVFIKLSGVILAFPRSRVLLTLSTPHFLCSCWFSYTCPHVSYIWHLISLICSISLRSFVLHYFCTLILHISKACSLHFFVLSAELLHLCPFLATI